MSNLDILIERPDGTQITVSTDMIEEDVVRRRCGLDDKED